MLHFIIYLLMHIISEIKLLDILAICFEPDFKKLSSF